MAYEREFGPLGPERGDWQVANLAYTFAVVQAGKKGRKLKIQDFVLKWATGRKRQSPEEMLNVFRALQAAQAARAAKPPE